MKTKFTTTFHTKTSQKGGKFTSETIVRSIERDSKGRFVSVKTAIVPVIEASRLFKDVERGMSGARVRGIIKSYSKFTPRDRMVNGFNSMIQIITDQYPLSDLQNDRLAYLIDKMTPEDFNTFYKRYQDDVDAIFYDSDARRAYYEQKTHLNTYQPGGGRLSDDEKIRRVEKLIDNLTKYTGTLKKDIDSAVRQERYESNGKLKVGEKRIRFKS
jgi:hypothetical protein